MGAILVTGATGTVGKEVVAALSHALATFRAGVRNPSKASDVLLRFEEPETIQAAVDGVEKVFLVTPLHANQAEYGKRVVDAAVRAEVKLVVLLSMAGAAREAGSSNDLTRAHRDIERHLEASGLPYAFLRPACFAQNFIHLFPPDHEGAIYLPNGNGTCAWVDVVDVAACAVEVLTHAGHENKDYTLTGPEALSVSQVAAIISEATGRTIRYVDVPEEAAKSAMIGAGASASLVFALAELNALVKAGVLAETSPDVERLLNRAPRTFAQFAADNAAAFRR